MTRTILGLTALTILGACGVDGEPIPPTASASVSMGSGGVYSSVGVGLSQGPVSVFFGL